jgi:predicted nucleic acid-binding protein
MCYLKGQAVISTQVMMEYYNVAVKKLKLDPAFAAQRLRLFAKFRVVSATPQ